jgi:hypothetical protein
MQAGIKLLSSAAGQGSMKGTILYQSVVPKQFDD